jgi:hypothetical protein
MYTSVRKLIVDGRLGKWTKVSDEEISCIVESIPGENMLRNAPLNRMDGSSVGDNLRHYIDRGYIAVGNGFTEIEKHPLDVGEIKQVPVTPPSSDGPAFASVREKGVFESAV